MNVCFGKSIKISVIANLIKKYTTIVVIFIFQIKMFLQKLK